MKTLWTFFLRAENFLKIAIDMDETGDISGYGNKSLQPGSHGEAFRATLTLQLKGNGLDIFDETEATLSAARQPSAMTVVHDLFQKSSQFIFATRSPMPLTYSNAKIIGLNNEGLAENKYEETGQYRIPYNFLNVYDLMMICRSQNDRATSRIHRTYSAPALCSGRQALR